MLSNAKLSRMKGGMTQEKVSLAIGINPKLLSMFETGKCVLPEKWKEPLANVLNITLEEICDEKGYATESQ